MKNKKCSWHNKCQNGGDGCFHHEPEKCVRYLPLQDTHITKINFTVETPPHIDSDAFTEMFINWLECMGWRCVGFSEPIKEEG
jgi:hypothetical protein